MKTKITFLMIVLVVVTSLIYASDQVIPSVASKKGCDGGISRKALMDRYFEKNPEVHIKFLEKYDVDKNGILSLAELAPAKEDWKALKKKGLGRKNGKGRHRNGKGKGKRKNKGNKSCTDCNDCAQ